MANLYTVHVRWVKTPVNPSLVEPALTGVGDWLRFDAWSWLIFSNATSNDISGAIRRVLHVDDSILVIKCDPFDYNGWAAQWVWDWISQRRNPPTGLGMLFTPPSPTNYLASPPPPLNPNPLFKKR
jgi:hypothetical protein